jgi:hypothetical protein
LKREKEQPDSSRGIKRELGSPPDTRSPEGLAREEGASQGYESSSNLLYCIYATCEVLFWNFNFKNIINIKNKSK